MATQVAPLQPSEAIEQIVTDMRIHNHDLCRGITIDTHLEDVFTDLMLEGCQNEFLKLLISTIAAENLNEKLSQAQMIFEQQAKVINQQSLRICELASALSWYQPDQLHWKQEIRGYGHAETRGPLLQYNTQTINHSTQLAVLSKDVYDGNHGTGRIVRVSLPS